MIESLNERTEATLPDWFQNWEQTGLIQWFDDGDGVLRYSAGKDNEIFRNGSLSAVELGGIRQQHQHWLDTQGEQGEDARVLMQDKGLSGPDRDIIVLATPEMAELASWIIALVAAGGLAAALSTASGLLLVISSSVAHDVYFRIINPQAEEKQRLLVARTVIGLAVVVAGLFGVYPPGFVSQVVAFALDFRCFRAWCEPAGDRYHRCTAELCRDTCIDAFMSASHQGIAGYGRPGARA